MKKCYAILTILFVLAGFTAVAHYTFSGDGESADPFKPVNVDDEKPVVDPLKPEPPHQQPPPIQPANEQPSADNDPFKPVEPEKNAPQPEPEIQPSEQPENTSEQLPEEKPVTEQAPEFRPVGDDGKPKELPIPPGPTPEELMVQQELQMLEETMYSTDGDTRYKALKRLFEIGSPAKETLDRLSALKPGTLELSYSPQDTVFQNDGSANLQIEIKIKNTSENPFWIYKEVITNGISGYFLPFGAGANNAWVTDVPKSKELKKIFNSLDPLNMIKELRVIQPNEEIIIASKTLSPEELRHGKYFYQYYGYVPLTPKAYEFKGNQTSAALKPWTGTFKAQGAVFVTPKISEEPPVIDDCEITLELDPLPLLKDDDITVDDSLNIKFKVKNTGTDPKEIWGLRHNFEAAPRPFGWWYVFVDENNKVITNEDINVDTTLVEEYNGGNFTLDPGGEKELKAIVKGSYKEPGKYTLIIGFNSENAEHFSNAVIVDVK